MYVQLTPNDVEGDTKPPITRPLYPVGLTMIDAETGSSNCPPRKVDRFTGSTPAIGVLAPVQYLVSDEVSLLNVPYIPKPPSLSPFVVTGRLQTVGPPHAP